MADQHENKQINTPQSAQITLIEGQVGTQGRLTIELVNQLNTLCDQLEDASRQGLGVLLLDLQNRPSCAEPTREKDVYLVSKWEKVLRRIELCEGAVVCAADEDIGHLGLALLLVSDHRVINEQSQLSLCNQQGHILAGCVLQRLAHQYGSGICRQLVLFGLSMGADEAKNIALVDSLARDSVASAKDFIARLQPLQITDIRVRRQLLLEAFHLSHDEALGAHLAACDRLLRANPVALEDEVNND